MASALEDAKQQLDAENQAQLANMVHPDPMVESAFHPQPYDPWDRYVGDRAFEPLGFGVADWPTDVEDTHRGDFIPFWRSIDELRTIQGTSRYLANYNEIGVSLLEGLANYAIHKGFTYEVESVKEGDRELAPEGLTRAVQKELNDFHKRTHWVCDLESTVFMESRSWGEQLIEVVNIGGGRATIDVIPMHQLSEPRESFVDEISQFEGLPPLDWRYGVGTTIDRAQEVLGYFIDMDRTGRNWRIARAADCVHIKLNVPPSVKRGLTDFYPLFRLLKKHAPLIYAMLVGAGLRASIGMIYKDSSKTGGVVPLGTTKTVTTPGFHGHPESLQIDPHLPGAIKHVRGPVELLAGPMGDAHEEGLVEIVQLGCRMVGLRWHMPEFVSSADASNMNRATSETAETPFVKSTERKQQTYVGPYEEIGWKALGIAAVFGKFRQFGVESRQELEDLVAINVTPPEVSTHNRLEEAQRHEIMIDKKVMSRRTCAELANLDPDIELQRITAESENEVFNPPMPEPFVGQAGQEPSQSQPRQPAASVRESQERTDELPPGEIKLSEHDRAAIAHKLLFEGYP